MRAKHQPEADAAALADGKDLLGDRDLDDLEGGCKEERHDRLLQGDDENVPMGPQIAQAVEILTHGRGDGFVHNGRYELGGHANLRQQRSRKQER